MEFLEKIYDYVDQFIAVPYLLIFMFLSYLVKKYFEAGLDAITKVKWQTVYTVLIIATIVGIPYALIVKEDIMKVIITYCVGTSLHEALFGILEKKIKERINK